MNSLMTVASGRWFKEEFDVPLLGRNPKTIRTLLLEETSEKTNRPLGTVTEGTLSM